MWREFVFALKFVLVGFVLLTCGAEIIGGIQEQREYERNYVAPANGKAMEVGLALLSYYQDNETLPKQPGWAEIVRPYMRESIRPVSGKHYEWMLVDKVPKDDMDPVCVLLVRDGSNFWWGDKTRVIYMSGNSRWMDSSTAKTLLRPDTRFYPTTISVQTASCAKARES